MVARVSTGVPGLDKMLGGGFLPGRVYLVRGGPGAGKTTLSVQFLMEGVKNGEHVLYVSLEEPISHVIEDMASFGFNMRSPNFHSIDATPVVERRHILEGVHHEEFSESFERLLVAVEKRITEYSVSRVVIDPITVFKLLAKDLVKYRDHFIGLVKIIMNYNATAIVTAGTMNQEGIEEYLANGVILLKKYQLGGRYVKGLEIAKMRGSQFDEEPRPYAFTSNGIVVYPEERIYSE